MAGETKTSSEKDAASTSAASSNPAMSKQKNQHTSMPKDAEVMISILKDMGVSEFEPRVVNQLLEFSYRYATNVLEEAREISAHAKKKAIDVDDVKLAVQMYAEQNMTQPPPRDILLDLARTKNAVPLPVPKPTCGLRLPPERHCLTACNYRLKFRPKRPPPGFGGGLKTGGPSASAKPLLVMPTQQAGKPLYTLELQPPAQTTSYGDAPDSKRFKLSMNP